MMGCGACALALLTGIPPGEVAARNGRVHYADKFMARFLRQNQFEVLKLTLCNLSMPKSEISDKHVLLVSQLYARNEATWCVIAQGMLYHNFQSYRLDSLSLLTKPLLSAYVVVHPRWRMHMPSSKTSAPKAGTKNKQFALAVFGAAKRAAVTISRSGSK